MRWTAGLLGIVTTVAAAAATAHDRSSIPKQLKPFFEQGDRERISRKIYDEALHNGTISRPVSASGYHAYKAPIGLTKSDLCTLDAVARHETCFRGKLIGANGMADTTPVHRLR